jgi:hypothetical protein
MTALRFLTSPEFGCCSTGELMAACKTDVTLLAVLKSWAIEEMTNRGIAITADSK